MLLIKRIETPDFRRFGTVIECPEDKRHENGNSWHIVATEKEGVGWRIAYLITRDRAIDRLERHPRTFESFEPVRGEALLYVAGQKDAACIECFYLDRPVILKKGVWHGIVATCEEAEIKITENADVECLFWALGFTLEAKEAALKRTIPE